jgi:hypothetical protein
VGAGARVGEHSWDAQADVRAELGHARGVVRAELGRAGGRMSSARGGGREDGSARKLRLIDAGAVALDDVLLDAYWDEEALDPGGGHRFRVGTVN